MNTKTCTIDGCDKAHDSRGYCSMHYRRLMKHGDPLWVKPTYTECTEDGCTSRPRNRTAQLCGKHYHRKYRHGSTSAVAKGLAKAHADKRYVRRYMPSHVLADRYGGVYFHRVVLYDKVGAGEQSCHWCGVTVHWFPSAGQKALCADHLDGDRMNNSTDNLEPSCSGCNSGRAVQARHERLKELGFWSENDTIAALRELHRHTPFESGA